MINASPAAVGRAGVTTSRRIGRTEGPALAVVLSLALGLLPGPGLGQAPAQPSPPAEPAGPFEVAEASIPELQEAMASGRTTAVELVEAYLARIAAYDQQGPRLNTIIRLNPDALIDAQGLDEERAAGTVRSPLHGVPIILKDNYDTADMPTTASSVALAGLIPPDDAFQVRKLREAGAIILGKSNMHELAAGITTISSLGGQTLNPYALTRYPGGSSGGTGAAIAASFAAVGWGSDTCGSIRIPASNNNLIGLRPTKGLSSIDGIIPLSHTQDVGGPLARSAIDLAIALDVTIGMDVADPATEALRDRTLPRFADELEAVALQDARIGVLTALFGDAPEDEEVGDVVRSTLAEMAAVGAEVIDIEIPGLDSLLAGSSVIAHEFKWDLIDYLAGTPGAPVGSLEEILERGLYHVALERTFRARNSPESRDSAEYREDLAKRPLIRDAVVSAMERHQLDALAYPTIRRAPAQVGDPQRGSNCQLSASSGLPALSVPAGFTPSGLPVGLELLGRSFEDARLLSLAYGLEQATSNRRAPFSTPPFKDGMAPSSVSFEVVAEGPAVRLEARFVFDPPTGVMTFDVGVSGTPESEVHAVDMHRRDGGTAGPVIHRLSGPGLVPATGLVTLTGPEIEALRDGRLYLGVYTLEHPAGAAREPLLLPPR